VPHAQPTIMNRALEGKPAERDARGSLCAPQAGGAGSPSAAQRRMAARVASTAAR
jgi:hypothetical protein